MLESSGRHASAVARGRSHQSRACCHFSDWDGSLRGANVLLSTKSLLLASNRSGVDLFLLDWGSKRSDNNNSKELFDLSVLPLMGPCAGCRYQTPTAFKFKLL